MRTYGVRDWVTLVWNTHIYREHYYELSTHKPLVIDAGANVGSFTIEIKRAFPEARVIAFEPNPETYQKLKENTKRLHRVRLFQKALSDKNGTTTFFKWRSGTGIFLDGSLRDTTAPSYWHTNKKTNAISVPTVRLSRFVNRPVDLLKLDIEGDEGNVLKELGRKLTLVNQISLEYHGNSADPITQYKILSIS